MAFDFAPAPKFAPARDLSWRTEGGEIRRTARLLGFEPMPWQQLVFDRATEWRPFEPGESEGDKYLGMRRYRYSRVLVTVPRQSGKTTAVGPVRIHRMLTNPNLSAFSTAQTGKDAGKRMLDLINLVTGSPLAPLFKPRFSLGSEGLHLPANGATLTRFSPKPDAIHGETPEWVDYDEIWKHSRELGTALEGAVGPAQITLHGRSQIWLFSTMGTALSGWMNDLIELGRSGNDPSLAYFEWSMPEGLDPYDPATWWAFHPALGNTLTEESMAEQTGLPYSEWMRAYMNRRVESVDALVAAEDLAKLVDADMAAPERGGYVLAYDVAHGNAGATIQAVWRDEHGNPTTHVVHSAPGSHWLADLVETLWHELDASAVAADDGGEARAITDELLRRGVPVETVGGRDFGTACVQVLAAARDDKTLRWDGARSMADAWMHAVLRNTGDSWRFSRRDSTGPIAALVALAAGLWIYDHAEQTGTPELYFGKD